LARSPRISIGGMGRRLFVASDDELDSTSPERIQ
jgi:hypothetical protein